MNSGTSFARHVVFLAGGENSRMEALRGTIYKAFLPIHGLSCIARHLLRAAAFGIERADVLVDSYDPALNVLAEPKEDQRFESVRPKVRILVHPGSPGEKISWWSREYSHAGPLMVVVGDTLAPVDLALLWRKAMEDGVDSTIAVAEVRVPFGVVDLKGSRVVQFRDNPVLTLLASTGYMVLGPEAIMHVRNGVELNAALERISETGLLHAVRCDGPIVAVDSLGSLAVAHELLAE